MVLFYRNPMSWKEDGPLRRAGDDAVRGHGDLGPGYALIGQNAELRFAPL